MYSSYDNAKRGFEKLRCLRWSAGSQLELPLHGVHSLPPATHTVVTSVRRYKLRWFWLDQVHRTNATATVSVV